MKKITQKQNEQLTILIEECAEVQQCSSKVMRFGTHNDYNSLDQLVKELGDLLGIMEWVVKEFDINPDVLIQYALMKQEKMKKWTFHQNDSPT